MSDLKFSVDEPGRPSLETSPTMCSCKHFLNFGLPCRHILSVRKHLGLALISPETILERWKVGEELRATDSLGAPPTTDLVDGLL